MSTVTSDRRYRPASLYTDDDVRRAMLGLWELHERRGLCRPTLQEARAACPINSSRLREIVVAMDRAGLFPGLPTTANQRRRLGKVRDDGKTAVPTMPEPEAEAVVRAREAASARGDAYDWRAWRREHLRRERGIRECVPRLRAEIGRREAEAKGGAINDGPDV